MAANLKSLLDKGIASVTVKSSSFLETSKLSNQINIAEGEIPRQKQVMGEAVYAAWCQQGSLEEAAAPFCEAIQELEGQIAELQQKIAAVKEESAKALGEEAARAAASGDRIFCSACGGENVGAAKFCCKCGNKMG